MNRLPSKVRIWQVTGCLVCLVALLVTLGGHWMALQSFAWARMLAENSRRESLTSAIVKTFDGKHPCSLCLAIEKAKSSEKKPDQQEPSGKIEGLLVVHRFALRGAAAYPSVVPPRHVLRKWVEAPPTPPPRWA